MSIQVLLPKFRTEECLAEIKECLDNGWTGIGFKTEMFEKQWCEYTKLPYAHFLNSNTVGLHLAIHLFKKHYNWQDDDEVISTPLTFISTNHAIMYENLRPVFADVDETLCLDPSSIESRITDRTRAVMYVGLGGNTGKLDLVSDLCKKYNLKLILDAAHMAGTYYKKKHVGSEADVAVFSFQAVKNLPTADSGMICFKDSFFDLAARKLSWLGINKDTYARAHTQGRYKWQYEVEDLGFKYHGNSIMAALGLVGLRYLDMDNDYRRMLVKQYETLLSHIPGIFLIEKAKDCVSSQHLFQIGVSNRDRVLEYLYKNDIYPGVHYRDNTEYEMYRYALHTCPRAQKISRNIISLPLHLHMTNQDVSHVCEVIKHAVMSIETLHE